jgi:hypothetical protein
VDGNNDDSPDQVKGFLARVRDDIEIPLSHLIGVASTILGMWGVQQLMRLTVGEGAMFYGFLPISYVTQTGDLIAMARCFWKLIKEF